MSNIQRTRFWRKKDGSIESCNEKIDLLEDGLNDLLQSYKDMIEDSVLMGCDIDNVKKNINIELNKILESYSKS